MDMEDFAPGVVSIYNAFDDPDEGIVPSKISNLITLFSILVPEMMLCG